MHGKFGRNYRLDIFTPSGAHVTVEPPFTLKFTVTRNTLASANKAQFTIYNLRSFIRNQVYKDRYSFTEYWRIQLWAGYGNRLHQVFTGNIYEAMSYKDGTEWVTYIDAFDGMNAIQNGFTATTVDAGVSTGSILTKVISDMPNVIAGIFGAPAEGESPRGQVLVGQSSEILGELTDGQYFIDQETINVLSDNETIPGEVIELDPSELLSTPRRRDTFLDVSTLFEGAIQVGHVYAIRSLEPRFNGQYKVMGFTHNVTISEAEGGNSKTDIQLYFGAEGLQEAGA